MKTRSLTRLIIGSVLLAELLCAASFSIVAILHEMHGRRRAFDVMLKGRADSLLGAVQDADDPEANVTVDPSELVLPKEDVYVVLSPTSRQLGESPNADASMVRTLTSLHKDGYFNLALHGVPFRALRTQGVRVIDRLENGGRRRPVVLLYAAPTGRLLHEVVEAARFYILTSALLLAVTGLLLAWLLRRWLSPLRDLAQSASRVSASSWEFAPTTAALQMRELEPIASSIQQLLRGLQQAFERQRQFTGDAAHELKTSLALLKSSLQLLTMRPRTAEQYEEGLQELAVDVQRMEELTEQMLALARIEEEPAKPVEAIDLATIVQAIAGRLQTFTAGKQVTLTTHAGSVCRVNMPGYDAAMLSSNLLMNAVQHSPPEAVVTVSVTANEGRVELRVTDRGDGVPEAALPHIFERFYRADVSRSRRSGGAGLGLAICKAIVERARGTIVMHSTPGQGTEVIVTLPETA